MIENMEQNNNTPYTDPAHKSLMDALKVTFRLIKFTMAMIIIGFLCSGIFVVKQHESALILRFGSIVGTPADRVLKAGLHWAWPYPVDQVIKLPTGRIQSLKIDNFWYHDIDTPPSRPGVQDKIPNALRPGLDGYMISGDVNIVHAIWTLRYKIIDPYTYYLTVQDSDTLLSNLFNSTIVSIAGKSSVDTILRTGIEQFRSQVERETQDKLAKLDCGIALQRLDIERITPPRQVKAAFDDVIQAEQEHSQKINEAKTYAAKIVNEAEGNASQIESESLAYQTNVIEEARADASYLEEVLDKYENSPEIFLFLAKQNTLKKIMDKLDDTFIFSQQNQREREIRLMLERTEKQR